ncbi:MAG: septum formation family protein [Gammaproteobacteria bacterium]|nr:septum formation family protein [Gammaproteobacteria bacterium]
MRTWIIYIAAAFGFVVYGVVNEADRDDSGAIVRGGNVDAFSMQIGDCFDDAGLSDEVSSLPGVPCSEPHDNEVYAVFDLTIETYPDDEALWELANQSCIERFEAFVGIDYDSSSLDVSTMYPTLESWKQDDREVVCAVYDLNANKLTGSVQGSGL